MTSFDFRLLVDTSKDTTFNIYYVDLHINRILCSREACLFLHLFEYRLKVYLVSITTTVIRWTGGKLAEIVGRNVK